MPVNTCGARVLTYFLYRPDTRKGVLRVVQGLDELTHLVWATRDGADEEDVIIFPAEAKFQKARAVRTRTPNTTVLSTR